MVILSLAKIKKKKETEKYLAEFPLVNAVAERFTLANGTRSFRNNSAREFLLAETNELTRFVIVFRQRHKIRTLCGDKGRI